MTFDLAEIQHIAELSRLRLTGDEEEKYGAQIASILDYMKMLDELKLKENKTTIHSLSLSGSVSDLENVWRQDEVSPWDEKEVELALSQAELEEGMIKVKRVL